MAKVSKAKTVYVCQECGHETSRWMGRCPSCDSWNTLEEQTVVPEANFASAAAAPALPSTPALTLNQIPDDKLDRVATGIAEFDRVLGDGVVPGSLILIGGDPGIGKSTLLLQVCDRLCKAGNRCL